MEELMNSIHKSGCHLSEEDITDGKEIYDYLEKLDPVSRLLVAVYARGLSDMQETKSLLKS
jgi:hypothetical protein